MLCTSMMRGFNRTLLCMRSTFSETIRKTTVPPRSGMATGVLTVYLLYSSTTRLSLMSWPNSERSGAPLNVPVIFFASTSTHDGKPTFSASCSASTIRSWPFARSATETTSPAAHDRGRHVQPLAVDEDRAVRHELARFGARAAHAHPVDDVVEARLEQLQQVLAGRALALRRLGEVAAELPLEHAVDAAELLLLAQLLAVVGDAHDRTSARADPAWFPACTWSRAIDARFSGKGRCLPVAPACIWGRCNEPCLRCPKVPKCRSTRLRGDRP